MTILLPLPQSALCAVREVHKSEAGYGSVRVVYGKSGKPSSLITSPLGLASETAIL